jgi:hypothetical protein
MEKGDGERKFLLRDGAKHKGDYAFGKVFLLTFLFLSVAAILLQFYPRSLAEKYKDSPTEHERFNRAIVFMIDILLSVLAGSLAKCRSSRRVGVDVMRLRAVVVPPDNLVARQGSGRVKEEDLKRQIEGKEHGEVLFHLWTACKALEVIYDSNANITYDLESFKPLTVLQTQIKSPSATGEGLDDFVVYAKAWLALAAVLYLELYCPSSEYLAPKVKVPAHFPEINDGNKQLWAHHINTYRSTTPCAFSGFRLRDENIRQRVNDFAAESCNKTLLGL